MKIVLDENGNRTVDGKRIECRDPLSYFSEKASIMHGRFGTYEVVHEADPEVRANVLADEERGVNDDIDPEFAADIAARVQFDRR